MRVSVPMCNSTRAYNSTHVGQYRVCQHPCITVPMCNSTNVYMYPCLSVCVSAVCVGTGLCWYQCVSVPVCVSTHVLTYLSPWLLLEHRPCTTSLQRLLSWAILYSCFQLSPVCVMSASRSRRQVFFGLPLFRLPWGFHVKACLVTLVFGFLCAQPFFVHNLFDKHVILGTYNKDNENGI